MAEESIPEIVRDLLYLDADEDADDPVMQRVAECVRELRPHIGETAERRGYGPTMAALIALVVNKAIAQDDCERIALALRQHAELLEAEEHIRGGGGTA